MYYFIEYNLNFLSSTCKISEKYLFSKTIWERDTSSQLVWPLVQRLVKINSF